MKTVLSSMLGAAALAVAAAAAAAPADTDGPYRHHVTNDLSRCSGGGPAVRVEINGITPAKGILRVQLYRGTETDWLKTGRWLNRIEVPARAAEASVCMPVPGPGTYGIAVRHDVNGNGKTDLREDGGGMSNNPAVSILNLGRPSYDKTAFQVGKELKTITIRMKYFF